MQDDVETGGGRRGGNPESGHHAAALRSGAVLVCICQDLTRPDLRPGTASLPLGSEYSTKPEMAVGREMEMERKSTRAAGV